MRSQTRRQIISGLGFYMLSACAGAPTLSALEVDKTSNPAFQTWLAGFRPRAHAAGISSSTIETALSNVAYLPEVITRDRTQIQTRRTLEDYLSIATSDERLSKGRRALSVHANTLNAIETRYGVDRHIVAAVWGLESQYGEKRGHVPVISATATLAFDARRGAFYESQLIAVLRILDRGDIPLASLNGSWAGAMGHTQFIPTSYEAFAVDFDQDGRRDIWSDDPTDALASTARYLARNGWRSGLVWGAEAGPNAPQGRIIQPQRNGVRFTVTRNFDVIKTYNNSDFYAIGVGHLADRLSGAQPLRGRFPPDANGLTKADRIAVQQGLGARGYDVGTIDGVIGPLAEAALLDFQQKTGLAATGTATIETLAALSR